MRTFLSGVLGKVPRPTPAMAVALLALLVAASGAAVAAGSFTASDGTITACRDNKTGVLRVINAQGGQTCTSRETTITWKDGITGKVADSEKLDNKDSTEFLGKTEQAADSAKLGGQAPSAYGDVVTGRINGVGVSAGREFAEVTGISDATTNQSSVETLSPSRDLVMRDFTVKVASPASQEEAVRIFSIVINGERVGLCEIVGNLDTTCTAQIAQPIPAGSVISLAVEGNLFGDGTTDALFGYRLTAT